MKSSLFILFVFLSSVISTVQANPMAGVDLKAMRERFLIENAAVESLSSLGADKVTVMRQITAMCEKTVYSGRDVAGSSTAAVDILAMVDVDVCFGDLVIALSKYTNRR